MRSHRRGVALRKAGSLLAGLGTMTALVFTINVSAVGADDATPKELANSTRFRESFGLRDSPEYVERSFRARGEFSNMDWGVPLSEDEAADLQRRDRIREGWREAITYAREQPEFAGFYFDQRKGGRAVFRFTKDRGEHERRIEMMAPGGGEMTVETAAYSLRELKQVQDAIFEDVDKLINEGISIQTIESNERSGRVIVSLKTREPGAETLLRERYGPEVETDVIGGISEDACNSRSDCGYHSQNDPNEPWKGGIKILRASNDVPCTSGFLARKGTNLVMITAGHCIQNNGGNGVNWKHHGQIIGDTLGETINVGGISDSDIGWIDVDNGGGVTPRDLFYAGGGSVLVRDFDDFAFNSEQDIGTPICRGAAFSGYICGQVNGQNIDKASVDGHRVRYLYRTDFDASQGDSGAPYFYNYTSFGVHADSKTDVDPPDPGTSWYTTTWRAQDDAGITLCLTSAC
jgi:hypothetical protein